MITCLLKGGVGNQLYQIAAAYSLSLKHKVPFKLDLNLFGGAMQGHKPSKYKDILYSNIDLFTCEEEDVHLVYHEKGFKFKEIPFDSKLFKNFNFAIDGYWQNPQYFKDHLKDFRKLIKFDNNLTKKVKNKLKSFKNKHIVGVHLRKGDYLNNPQIFPIPQVSYYKNAIKKFDKKNTVFLYCTDDKTTLNDFKFDKNNIFINGDEVTDLCVLSHCDSLILANSSFSAMASYLVKDKEKVICPPDWFGSGVQDKYEIYDDSWERL